MSIYTMALSKPRVLTEPNLSTDPIQYGFIFYSDLKYAFT